MSCNYFTENSCGKCKLSLTNTEIIKTIDAITLLLTFRDTIKAPKFKSKFLNYSNIPIRCNGTIEILEEDSPSLLSVFESSFNLEAPKISFP